MQAPDVANIDCTDDNVTNCTKGEIPYAGNGIMTGNCTPEGRCEIKGWCPTEIEDTTITYARHQIANVMLVSLICAISYADIPYTCS